MKCPKCNTKMELEVTEFAEGVSITYICYNDDCDRNVAHHYTEEPNDMEEKLQDLRGYLLRLKGFLEAEAAGYPRQDLNWVVEALEIVKTLQLEVKNEGNVGKI